VPVKRYDLGMKEENKLLVFDKKEILIVLVFILGLFAASFIFGVKVGKDYSFSNSSVTKEELETLEVLSSKEEVVEEVIKKSVPPPSKEASYDLLKKKIEEELQKTEKNKLTEKISSTTSEKMNEIETVEKNEVASPSPTTNYYSDNQADEDSVNAKENEKEVVDSKVMASIYEGKWTIQLSSHKKIRDAKIFANDFKVRGYEPIINEVDLADKGTWYRVSLGAFDSLVEAKNYVIKESILFEEVDHVFIQFE
tara:strand:+ start:364 stop:1122 length:759 start_codon:yes stop_codon:yes gene_type:complete